MRSEGHRPGLATGGVTGFARRLIMALIALVGLVTPRVFLAPAYFA